MTTPELPPPEIPAKPLDEATLSLLLSGAMKAARDALSQFEPNSQQLEITRPNNNGFGRVTLQGPEYGRIIWREAQNLTRLPESQALADYLWSNGSARMSFIRAHGKPAERPVWDRAIWGELLHSSLHWLMYGAALEDLVLSGEYQKWRLAPSTRETACADIAQQRVRGQRTLAVECLIGAALPSTEEFELEPGIFLKQLTTEEQCVHFTKFDHEYSSDDFYSASHQTRLRVTKTISDLSHMAGGAEIAEAIDRVKWAICIGSERCTIFREGPVIVRGLDGFRGPTLRRQECRLGTEGAITVNLSLEDLGRAREELRELTSVSNVEASRRLRNAIWLFGRACTAALAR